MSTHKLWPLSALILLLFLVATCVPADAGTAGTGTVTISGAEQSIENTNCTGPITCTTYDSGSVSITVNGFTKSTVYGRYSGNSDPVKSLEATKYDFLQLPQGSWAGAQTNRPARGGVDVDINVDGVFVTGTDGVAWFAGHKVDAKGIEDIRAIILLHELGHQLGFFPADLDASLNWEHTHDIITHCVPFATVEVK